MLVYSHDKKTIIEASCLMVQKNIVGGKGGKYIIGGWRNALGDVVVCEQYPDEQSAIEALEKVFKAFADGASYYTF